MRASAPSAVAVLLGLMAAAAPVSAQTSDMVSRDAFRVCADPANVPMSDDKGTGYENKIAELMAGEIGLPLEYTWYPMATGFIRRTLRANLCDVVIGYAQGDSEVLNTNHWMTSAFVLIVRQDGPLTGVDTLADPRLKDARLGIIAGTPPADHMARNGLLPKAKPYPLFVDRHYGSPADDMLRDLEAGEIDAAILWGPLAGPLVKTTYPGLKLTPLTHETLPPRMYYRITMGVRPGEEVWQRKLNGLIRRNQARIDAILTEAGVPILNDMGTEAKVVGQ